jgi:hypothetical protein
MQNYSDFFQTLHDETTPTGYLGRGTHYSVLRAVVWHGPDLRVLSEAHYLDFAIIWDEDHDIRVIDATELLYKRAWLSSAIIIGERKASFTFLMPDDLYKSTPKIKREQFQGELDELMQSFEDDPWNGYLGSICTGEHSIINDQPEKVRLYLKTIKMLWKLGIKPIV